MAQTIICAVYGEVTATNLTCQNCLLKFNAELLLNNAPQLVRPAPVQISWKHYLRIVFSDSILKITKQLLHLIVPVEGNNPEVSQKLDERHNIYSG